MRRTLTIAVLLFVGLTLAVVSARATVDLTLYNSFSLLDSNGTTSLEGISTVGHLVQLISVGPNGVIDPPTVTGDPNPPNTPKAFYRLKAIMP